ncbi:MAG: immunoglobulin-like domain-containing protein, partial [Woeseiaceae bacterium]
ASSPNLVYFGDGSGAFGIPRSLGDNDSRSVAVGRFDNNNRMDIAFANVGATSRVYTKNSGGTAFTLRPQLAIGDAAAVAAADLNGDGIDDLVFGRIPSNVNDIPSNPVLINAGGGSFGVPLALLGLSPTRDVLIGDVNEDGSPDLVFISSTGVHQIWLATGGTYTLYDEQIMDLDAGSAVLINLGDAAEGDPGGVDLALGGRNNAGVGVWLNDSAGNLGLGDAVPPTLTLTGEASVSVPANTGYNDAGATALDNIDGDISSSIVVNSSVNTSIVGTYTVTYSVQDRAGNSAAQISRSVSITPNSGGGGGGGGGAVGYWLLTLLLTVFALRKTSMHKLRIHGVVAVSALLLLTSVGPAQAQEVRYSWLDMSVLAQDFDRGGVQVPIPGQSVEVIAGDGSGVRFRGSLGTWKNMYLLVSYGSTDNDVDAIITNDQGVFETSDEYDFTAIRSGIGVKWSIRQQTDLFAEVTYDSTDLDFGSFAGENFDTDAQEIGGALGLRTMFGDHFELMIAGRYTQVGDVDLNTLEFDDDTLFSVGFAWEVIRGFSIVGDYESGELGSYGLGFRLDLSED